MARPSKAVPAATLPEVAKAAGVSTATAARALGGYGSVSAKTTEKVHRAAERLGYRTNSLARSMITGKTHTIGVVFPDIQNPFFSQVFRGITEVARAQGYEALLIDTDEDAHLESTGLKTLAERRVEGVIVAPTDLTRPSAFGELVGLGIPIVLLDRGLAGLQADTVVVDNVAAARDATSRLVALGHTRIAVVTGADHSLLPRLTSHRAPDMKTGASSTGIMRTWGYRQALRTAGIPFRRDLVSAEGYRPEQAAAATVRLMTSANPPTAVVAFDSLLALGVITGLRQVGLTCPNDVSLIGFDDAPWAPYVTPPLSVIRQPVFDLGAEATRLLLGRMSSGSQELVTRILPTTFIDRQSVSAPAVPNTPL